MFKLFLEGYGYGQIIDELNIRGYKTKTGRTFGHNSIAEILRNEKYMGDSMLQKTCSVDFLSKKRLKNDGIIDRYYVSNSHPAIISKEKFEQVQEEKARRARLVKNADGTVTASDTKYSGKYLLGNLLVCGECGASYRRRTERGKVIWRCATRIEKGRESCANSPSLEEEILKDAVMQVINSVMNNEAKYELFNEYIVRQLVQSICVVSKVLVVVRLKTDVETRQRITL